MINTVLFRFRFPLSACSIYRFTTPTINGRWKLEDKILRTWTPLPQNRLLLFEGSETLKYEIHCQLPKGSEKTHEFDLDYQILQIGGGCCGFLIISVWEPRKKVWKRRKRMVKRVLKAQGYALFLVLCVSVGVGLCLYGLSRAYQREMGDAFGKRL